MKKFFVALLMLLTIPAFATGVGSTASNADCDNATLNTYTGTSNLSAGWQPNTIALHWYNGDTEITSGVQTSCTYDGTLTPPSTIPTKTGYTFKGWRVRSVLPAGYTKLEYIESTSTQYIDTGYIPNQNTKVELSYQYTGSSSTQLRRFGSREAGSTNGIFLGYKSVNTTILSITYGNQTFETDSGYKNTSPHIEVIDKNKYYFDGVLEHIFTEETFTCPSTAVIFAGKQMETTGNISDMKCFYCKLYDDGTLVRNFIPAKRISDNEIGLYDTVTNTFFTNAGTGDFIAGPEVSN